MIGQTAARTLSLLALLSAPALAQERVEGEGDTQVQVVPKNEAGEVYRFEIPDWSSDRIERIGSMLVGSWRSDQPVAARDGGEAVPVWMHIAKTHIDGFNDVLYVEAHRADAAARPYRQSFMQLYEIGGTVRLRTLEPTRLVDGLDAYAGFWAIPDQFPPLDGKNMIATLDIELSDEGSTYRGRSPHRYPTAQLGAVEVASEMRFDGQTLALADRGYDAGGQQVWGPAPDEWIGFTRDSFPLDIEQSPMGLTILTYPTDLGPAPVEGQLVRYAYDGWLFDGGRLFASSDVDGVMPTLTWPPKPNQMNWAWEEVVQKTRLGMVKRFIAPPERAYRMMGLPAKGVPPMARVVFHMECIAVEDAPAEEEKEVGSAG